MTAPAITTNINLRLKEIIKPFIHEGDFTLASGRRSKWMVDAQSLMCSEPGFSIVGENLGALCDLWAADSIGGPGFGGMMCGLVTVCARPGVKAFCARPGPGFDLTGEPQGRTILVDDVVTTGGSLLHLRHKLRDVQGVKLVHVTAVFDRSGDKARGLFAEEGFSYTSLCDLNLPEVDA